MKILITGAAGFVGRYAIRQLAQDGHAVHAAMLPAEALSLQEQALCTVHHFDLLSAADTAALLNRVQPDAILHLAAQSSVAVSWKQPQMTADVNIKGTLNLLDAARMLPQMPRILLIGSAEEYGGAASGECSLPEDAPLHPVNIYAATKAAAEQLAAVYHRAYALPVICVRAFNHIGPAQRPDFAVSDFCRQTAEIEHGLREAVIRTGDLSARRDFTDVRDIVRAYALLLEKGRAGEIYNVGSGRTAALSDVLQMILEAGSVPIRHETDPARLRPAETGTIAADCTKLRTDTGWAPVFPLAQTVSDMLAYWRSAVKENT